MKPGEDTTEVSSPNSVALSIPEAGFPADPRGLGLLYFKATVAEQLAKRIRNHVKDVLESGGEVEGLFLKPGTKRQKVTNTRQAFEVLRDELGGDLAADEFLRCCGVNMGQLETLFHLKRDGGTIQDNKKRCREVLSEVIETSRSAPSVGFSKPENRQ